MNTIKKIYTYLLYISYHQDYLFLTSNITKEWNLFWWVNRWREKKEYELKMWAVRSLSSGPHLIDLITFGRNNRAPSTPPRPLHRPNMASVAVFGRGCCPRLPTQARTERLASPFTRPLRATYGAGWPASSVGRISIYFPDWDWDISGRHLISIILERRFVTSLAHLSCHFETGDAEMTRVMRRMCKVRRQNKPNDWW